MKHSRVVAALAALFLCSTAVLPQDSHAQASRKSCERKSKKFLQIFQNETEALATAFERYYAIRAERQGYAVARAKPAAAAIGLADDYQVLFVDLSEQIAEYDATFFAKLGVLQGEMNTASQAVNTALAPARNALTKYNDNLRSCLAKAKVKNKGRGTSTRANDTAAAREFLEQLAGFETSAAASYYAVLSAFTDEYERAMAAAPAEEKKGLAQLDDQARPFRVALAGTTDPARRTQLTEKIAEFDLAKLRLAVQYQVLYYGYQGAVSQVAGLETFSNQREINLLAEASRVSPGKTIEKLLEEAGLELD
jgi:hypothetical protein